MDKGLNHLKLPGSNPTCCYSDGVFLLLGSLVPRLPSPGNEKRAKTAGSLVNFKSRAPLPLLRFSGRAHIKDMYQLVTPTVNKCLMVGCVSVVTV